MPKETFFNLPEEKRQQILDLAIDEFATHDYKNASISRIVARAGIAKGSFYQYFEDKRELYFYLLELASGEKKRFLAQSQPPDPAMGLFEYLTWLFQAGAQFELSRPALAQVAYRALFSDRPFGNEPLEELQRATQDYYASLVDLGVTQGSIDPGIDRAVARLVISATLNEFARFALHELDVDPQDLASGKVTYQRLPVEDLARSLIHILAYGLAPRPAKP